MNKTQTTYMVLIGVFGFIFVKAVTMEDIPEFSYIFLIPLIMAMFGLFFEIKNGVNDED